MTHGAVAGQATWPARNPLREINLPAWFATARTVAAATATAIAATTAKAVATTAAAAGGTGFARAGFVNREAAAIELRAVECFNGAVRARIFRHFDEAEAP